VRRLIVDSKPKTRGGARPGAGRKRGGRNSHPMSPERHRIKRSFTLRPQTSQALDAAIAAFDRSEFVDNSIQKCLNEAR